jgi:prophage regulatory protein
MSLTILRLPGVRARYPKSRSSLYADIARGLFVPPIALGPRCVGWPAHEVEAILEARVAGASTDMLKHLVRNLVAQRIAERDKAATHTEE